VVGPHNGVPTLSFRLANQRRNQILQAEVGAALVRDEETTEGVAMRRFYDLKLARGRSPIFAMTFTAMHVIDADSPLFGRNSDLPCRAERRTGGDRDGSTRRWGRASTRERRICRMRPVESPFRRRLRLDRIRRRAIDTGFHDTATSPRRRLGGSTTKRHEEEVLSQSTQRIRKVAKAPNPLRYSAYPLRTLR